MSEQVIKNDAPVEKQVNINEVKELHIHTNDLNCAVKLENQNKANDINSNEAWKALKPANDIRNLQDKLKAVCQDISSYRLNKYIREASIGKTEQQSYDERDISAIKYIVFEECQDELMCFYEKNNEVNELTLDEIKSFLCQYISRAKIIIEDKRKEFYYPELSDKLIEKIILDLIDECYLSFDKEGRYE